MRIAGLIITLLGGIVHANIAAKMTIDWRYWALAGALIVVYIGGYITGLNVGRYRNDESEEDYYDED